MFPSIVSHFSFNATASTHIYTLSLHDALPIWCPTGHHRRRPADRHAHLDRSGSPCCAQPLARRRADSSQTQDRKSTRLNSSHLGISYAVFCLKKKKSNKYCTSLHIIISRIMQH